MLEFIALPFVNALKLFRTRKFNKNPREYHAFTTM